ncbi:MAG: Dyp-type peroxidase [Gammaproteobacteria bacterium]|nr:Dyp-type peroxidase [Gammaproteobacteria bacterium]MCW8986080.1 Dyp-type peroxidase [Gammaproteobacteria bacterium]
MSQIQKGILSAETQLARYMSFNISDARLLKECLADLKDIVDGESVVVGFGLSLVKAMKANIKGLHVMPADAVPGIDIPSTQSALWLWLRGDDRGDLYHRSRMLVDILATSFELEDVVDSFQFDTNRDLSGYEDGTENPEGDEAISAAIVSNEGEGLDGSSFVAVQQWLHDIDNFSAMEEKEQDDIIGRHISDNEEFDEAPESAHVKRAAQESFDPEAFVLRRSMPWAEGMNAGLVFVAFGKSFAAFEAILNRMLGKEDGIQDGLFQFTRPMTGAYFWCPPMKGDKLDLRAVNIS